MSNDVVAGTRAAGRVDPNRLGSKMNTPTPPHVAARPGWSLIELVVVVAVVGILIAVLLPILSASRDVAAQAQCLSNQAGNAKSLVFESVNNEGRFPDMGVDWKWVGGQGNPRLKVKMIPKPPHVSGLAAFDPEQMVCPSDGSGAAIPVATRSGAVDTQLMSYGYSVGLPGLRRGIYDIPQPSIAATFFDGYLSDDDTLGGGNSVVGFYPSMLVYARSTAEHRHDGQMTVLFADWHAALVPQLEPDHVLEVNDGKVVSGGWGAQRGGVGGDEGRD